MVLRFSAGDLLDLRFQPKRGLLEEIFQPECGAGAVKHLLRFHRGKVLRFLWRRRGTSAFSAAASIFEGLG